MERIHVLLAEYNNLWQEKLIHKQQISKFMNYLVYLASTASLILTFIGLSPSDIFKDDKIYHRTMDIATMLLIPFVPVICIILTFRIADFYHIYVIGYQIERIENMINEIIGVSNILTWQSQTCQAAYPLASMQGCDQSRPKVRNLIKLTEFYIFMPLMVGLCLLTWIIGSIFLYNKFDDMPFFAMRYVRVFGYYIEFRYNLFVCAAYTLINLYFLLAVSIFTRILVRYMQPNNPMRTSISLVNEKFPQRENVHAAKSDQLSQPAEEQNRSIIYHGNTIRKIFHKPDCQSYKGKKCTAVFRSRESAINAGYKPCGTCRP